MKVYFLKPLVLCHNFEHGVPYNYVAIENRVQGVAQGGVVNNQFMDLTFDEFDTEDTKQDELEVEIGLLQKYGQTTLHATRTAINPLYPQHCFELYVSVGSLRSAKVTQANWLARLPLWLWTQIIHVESINDHTFGSDCTKLFIQIKDGQRVWDIMEKMSVLENTLK